MSQIIIPGSKQTLTVTIDRLNKQLNVENPEKIGNLDVVAIFLQSALGVLQSEIQTRDQLSEQLTRQQEAAAVKIDGTTKAKSNDN